MSESIHIEKVYNDDTEQWEGKGVEYIVNDDGSNKITPDELKGHLTKRIQHAEAHGIRVNQKNKLEFEVGEEWIEVKGGGETGGLSAFAGSGNEVTIPHGLEGVPVSAHALPTENPQGYLGEVWVRFDATNIYVGNTGSYTGAMSWTAVPQD